MKQLSDGGRGLSGRRLSPAPPEMCSEPTGRIDPPRPGAMFRDPSPDIDEARHQWRPSRYATFARWRWARRKLASCAASQPANLIDLTHHDASPGAPSDQLHRVQAEGQQHGFQPLVHAIRRPPSQDARCRRPARQRPPASRTAPVSGLIVPRASHASASVAACVIRWFAATQGRRFQVDIIAHHAPVNPGRH